MTAVWGNLGLLNLNAKSSDTTLDRQQLCVDGHAYDRVDGHGVELINFGLAANAAGDNQLALGKLAEASGGIDGKALHETFAIDMGVEKRGGVGFELGDGIVWRQVDTRLPSLDGDATVFCVDTGDYAICTDTLRELSGECGVDCAGIRKERGANDDALRACIQHLLRAINRVDAASGLAGETLGDLRDERGVIALAHGGIEIDQLDQRESRELFNPVFEVVESEAQFFALHKLDDAAAQQINGRNQHGSLTETPARANSCLRERALDTPK